MSEINLTQQEADALIRVEKHRADNQEYEYPGTRGSISIPLLSADKREKFLLDIRTGRIDLKKGTYQNRCRQVIHLLRLDFGSSPHRNPDGKEIASPHLHIYREGSGDKWAFAVPDEAFSDLSDRWQTLHDFMKYCNITKEPRITRGLFS